MKIYNLIYNTEDFFVKHERNEEEISRQKEAYQDKPRQRKEKEDWLTRQRML